MKRPSKNKKILTVVAVSGYFNPLHVGHLDLISQAKKLGDYLVVIINNDAQVKLKGSVPFMTEEDRLRIVRSLRDVDEVVLAIDQDQTVCRSLQKIKPDIFANGGDRHNVDDIPEFPICQKLNIKMVDGLGKKIRASSIIIARAKKLSSAKKLIKVKKLSKSGKSVLAKKSASVKRAIKVKDLTPVSKQRTVTKKNRHSVLASQLK